MRKILTGGENEKTVFITRCSIDVCDHPSRVFGNHYHDTCHHDTTDINGDNTTDINGDDTTNGNYTANHRTPVRRRPENNRTICTRSAHRGDVGR